MSDQQADNPGRLLTLAHLRTPAWRALQNATELRVASALHVHARRPGSIAYPGIRRLADETTIDRRHVQRALRDMARRDVIIIAEAGGGRKRSAGYRLLWIEQAGEETAPHDAPFIDETATSDAPFPGDETAHTDAPFTSRNGASGAPKRRVYGTETARLAHKRAPSDAPEQYEQDEQQQEQPAAAAADLREALKEAGIGEPTRGELAARPGLTAQRVRDLASMGKATARLVLDLRAEADRTEAEARRRAKRAEPTPEPELSPEDEERLYREALDKLAEPCRPAWAGFPPGDPRRRSLIRDMGVTT